MAVERKYERDIDLLLAEEFAVSPPFADWFRCQTKFRDRPAKVVDVFVSKSDNLGESDLIVLYEAEGGELFALMIEDKVDAPLQPLQAERYRLRAARDVTDGTYGDYETVLCAPRFYLDARPDRGGFDHAIALEDLAPVIGSDGSLRASYRANFIATATTRRANTWTRRSDATTNAFWDAAYAVATREFPILEMKRPTVTEGSTWINFRPRDMPTMPRRVYISLKGDRGQIDLTFSNTTAALFHPHVAELLDADMSIHQTSASTAIRLETTGFRTDEGEVGLASVRQAFEASQRLIELYRRHRVAFDGAADAAA